MNQSSQHVPELDDARYRLRGSIDLVITVELSNAIKQQWPDMPIMIATGFAEMAVETDGSLPKLAKPFTEAELRGALDRVVRARDPGRVLKFRTRPSAKN